MAFTDSIIKLLPMAYQIVAFIMVLEKLGEIVIVAIKPLLDEYKVHRTSKQYQERLFGFIRDQSMVTTGQLRNSFKLDPEDKEGAKGILSCIYNVLHPFKRKKMISYVDLPSALDFHTNIISIGGPLSNKLTEEVGFKPPFRKSLKPLLPLYLKLDPSVKEKVVRKFWGRWHERPRWQIIDDESKDVHLPLVGRKSVLERDLLLVTVKHSSFPVSKNTSRKTHAMFTGLYGTASMAIPLMMKNKNNVLQIIDEQRHGSPYFQTLLEVTEIDHSGDFSRGADIKHIVTYPLWEQKG